LSSLEALAEERDRLRLEAREILDEMRKDRVKLVKLRSELQSLRKARDELNETVRALKKNRDQLRDSSRKKITSLKNLRKKSGKTFEGVRAEHDMAQLEWHAQTTSLEKEEEKQLMAKIQGLEAKVDSYKKVQLLSQKVDKDRNEADDLHARVQELAKTSQAHHEDILHLTEKFREVRQKLDDQGKRLDEVKARTREVSEKYFQTMTMTREADRVTEQEKAKAHKESLKSSAKKKLSQGEKVSLHELGALLGEEEEE